MQIKIDGIEQDLKYNLDNRIINKTIKERKNDNLMLVIKYW